MPKFDAGSVGAIEYDFTGWGIDDKGVVPEPSRSLVNETMKKMSIAFKELGMEDVEESPEGISSAMNKIEDEDRFEEMSSKFTDCLAEICGGHPSRDSIEKLPYRMFMAFFGYIMGEVMDPQDSRPGTKSSQNRLKSA